MRYEVAIKGVVAEEGVTPVPNAGLLDSIVDALMGTLLDLDADDVAVSGTLSTMTLEIEMAVDAETAAQAVAEAEETLTTAMVKLGYAPGGEGEVSRAFPEWTARREDALTPA